MGKFALGKSYEGWVMRYAVYAGHGIEIPPFAVADSNLLLKVFAENTNPLDQTVFMSGDLTLMNCRIA